MKTTVLVIKNLNNWPWALLIRSTDGAQTYDSIFGRRTLIEAIDVACLLKLRIDNADQLPLKQYRLVD